MIQIDTPPNLIPSAGAKPASSRATQATPLPEVEGVSMRDEVLAGLRRRPRTLPSKFFYDDTGSRLFERICELPEYYLTRTELSILRDHLPAISGCVGPDATLIEYGSGSSVKTRLLLHALHRPAGYVPIDISASALAEATEGLRSEFPRLPIQPLCADYTRAIDLDGLNGQPGRRVVFFPGSTIGNFDPPDAVAFLRRARRMGGPRGGMLIGVDLKKDPAVLHAAYNDAEGVTAAFNRNLLLRLNRELGAEFEPRLFHHHAFYNAVEKRIEMHLLSRRRQRVRVAGEWFSFARGEPIHTESSYKYTVSELRVLAGQAGWSPRHVWIDRRRWFAIFYLFPSGSAGPVQRFS